MNLSKELLALVAPLPAITYIDADSIAETGNTVLDGPGTFGPTTSSAVIHNKITAENLGATAHHFTSPGVAVNDGALVLCESVLGTWNTATEGLTVTLYTDDLETSSNDDRTWFYGVGHSVSTLNLSGCG